MSFRQPGLHNEFHGVQGYLVGSCLKHKQTNKPKLVTSKHPLTPFLGTIPLCGKMHREVEFHYKHLAPSAGHSQ